MSWFTGWLSDKIPPEAAHVLSDIHPPPAVTIVTPRICIAAGGPHETLHFHKEADPRPWEGWLVSGLGILPGDGSCTFLGTAEWQALMESPGAPDFSKLDGHFVACRWGGDRVEVFSDQIGLRTMYAARTAKGVFFGTRPDWVCRLSGESTPDFETLGPRWLCFNQMTYGSGVRNVERLGPGGRGVITPGSVEFSSRPWSCGFTGGSESAFRSRVFAVTNPLLPGGKSLSVGLSGGLDSRTLLASALRARPSVDVHVFGDPRDPDVAVAGRIAQGERLPAALFHDDLPGRDECIALITAYAAEAQLSEPATSALKLRYYGRLAEQGRVMVDGGFGELCRRQFLNRLRYRGMPALRAGDTGKIVPHLRIGRAELFARGTTDLMERGVILQLESVLEAMPPISWIGEGNFLDLFSIRARVPNYGIAEQARVDGILPNYMPLAQPSVIRAALSIPVEGRKGGRLFRSLIRDERPSLSRYPLVKKGTTYPYALTSAAALVWTTMKQKAGATYRETVRDDLLRRIRPFVLDTLASSPVRTYEAYDYGRISRIVTAYFAGEARFAGSVDWWLTFELWRMSLKKG